MSTTIDTSVLTSYFSAQESLSSQAATRNVAVTPAAQALRGSASTTTAPWQSASTAPKQSALVSSVLAGGAFFNNAMSNELSGGTGAHAADFQKLFKLYQGINALQGLATDAGSSTVTPTQLAAYSKAFSSGLTQLSTYLGSAGFKSLSVVEGAYNAKQSTTVATQAETDTYVTRTVFSGKKTDPVPAFAGSAAFNITLTSPFGKTKTVAIDLSQMGSTARTMPNVVNYINATLKAAGAETTISLVDTPVAPVTTTANGKTVTISTPPDNFAFKINGVSNEALSFSAATTSPVVYLAAGTVNAGSTTTTTTSATGKTTTSTVTTTATSPELLKLNTTTSGAQPAQTTALATAVQTARATATGPDGSVYVIGDVTGATLGGEKLLGSQETALMKYDSAGTLLYSRVIGGTGSDSGYALTVSADGSTVAVAATATAAPLNASATSTTAATPVPTSFVSTYTAAGDLNWTTSETSVAAGPAKGLAFGAGNVLYVTGSSTGHIPNATTVDGTGAYLQAYSTKGKLSFTQQFGASGTNPAGVAVSGTSVYVASAEGQQGVVRAFNVSGATPTQTATRSLGALDGKLAGIGISSTGTVIVAGSTTNGALSAGTVKSAYSSGEEGFVANLNASLTASSAETLSYVSAGGNLTATAMTVAGGAVYIAGTVPRTAPAGSGLTKTTQAFVASVNPTTGATTWSNTVQGPQYVANATSIAVSANDSPILDAFGLPNAINYKPSALVTSATGAPAGSSFYVKSGSGVAQQVVVTATDTYATLAAKIARASGSNAKATTSTIGAATTMTIAPATSTTSVSLLNGPPGSDALAYLGLNPGTVSNQVTVTSSMKLPTNGPLTVGLNLSSQLNLNSPAGIKAAQAAMALAGAKIENAYTAMTSTSGSTTSGTSAAAIAAIAAAKSKVANYNQALNWLANNESSSSSSTTATGSLASLFS